MADKTTTPDKTSSKQPKRFIYNDTDHQAWKDSPVKNDLLRVVGAMGKSCAHAKFVFRPENPLESLSPAVASLRGSLEKMLTWIDDIPPVESTGAGNSIRFGNPAFQKWHARLKERSVSIIKAMYEASQSAASMSVEEANRKGKEAAQIESEVLPEDPSLVLELSSYLHDAFGHPVRLDYGTGHESSFMIVLYGACKLGWLDEEAAQQNQAPSMEKLKSTAISIFKAYLQVTRQLQTQYRLEPAGSHGVWGLDDYHCLPFYFGACQCQCEVEVDEMPHPRDITDLHVRERYAETLLYFGCMKYICKLKQGTPLFECSPMLYDISQTCSTWCKVATGLLRLYEGEVLNKRQVVQHFTFGQKLFVANWKPSVDAPPEAPTANFRTDGNVTGAAAPMVRAPWADNPGGAGDSAAGTSAVPPSGRAPWANKNTSDNIPPST